jgi:hypothetical protein
MTLLIPSGLEKGLDLRHHVVLKLRRQFVKEAYHALEFFVRGLVKHLPLAGFEALLTDLVFWFGTIYDELIDKTY